MGPLEVGCRRLANVSPRFDVSGEREEEIEPIPEGVHPGRDLAANFWRDEGHPPFMKPPRGLNMGNRMLDADKLV